MVNTFPRHTGGGGRSRGGQKWREGGNGVQKSGNGWGGGGGAGPTQMIHFLN